MNKNPLHTCSFCGGKVFQVQEDVILKFPKHLAVIEEAAVGKCGECGEHYHLPETSFRIEKKLEKLLHERKISKREQTKVEIFYASEIPIQEALLAKNFQKRIEVLETAIGLSG
ncbi:YgiT-type zinc finger protein [Candidatus Poribacteria bacterium]|nr:YgiT-type zinc finger protein [Candidatus Poribacteria bacterium]